MAKRKKGKATIEIWPVDRLEYIIIEQKLQALASQHGKYYHARYTPGKVKK